MVAGTYRFLGDSVFRERVVEQFRFHAVEPSMECWWEGGCKGAVGAQHAVPLLLRPYCTPLSKSPVFVTLDFL